MQEILEIATAVRNLIKYTSILKSQNFKLDLCIKVTCQILPYLKDSGHQGKY